MIGSQRTAQRHLFESILDNEPDRTRSAIEAGANPNLFDREDPELWRLFSFSAPTGSFALYEAIGISSRFKTLKTMNGLQADANVEVIRVLLQNGAKVNQVNDEGYSALHQAAVTNNSQALILLINSDADLNLCSIKGYAPLHTAIYGRSRQCVDILISSGASLRPGMLDENAVKTPLKYSKFVGNQEITAIVESELAMQAMTQIIAQDSLTKNRLKI